jgi:hypothetical protein
MCLFIFSFLPQVTPTGPGVRPHKINLEIRHTSCKLYFRRTRSVHLPDGQHTGHLTDEANMNKGSSASRACHEVTGFLICVIHAIRFLVRVIHAIRVRHTHFSISAWMRTVPRCSAPLLGRAQVLSDSRNSFLCYAPHMAHHMFHMTDIGRVYCTPHDNDILHSLTLAPMLN